MKRTLGYVAVAALLGMTAALGTAAARSIPAFSGRAGTGADDTCFTINPDIGSIGTNTNPGCTGRFIRYLIGLHADSNGSKSIQVEYNSNNTASQCRSVGISRTGTNFTSSGFVQTLILGHPVTMVLNGATQVSQGIIYVDCQLFNPVSLIQVDWNN
jgi:hypothetical protein